MGGESLLTFLNYSGGGVGGSHGYYGGSGGSRDCGDHAYSNEDYYGGDGCGYGGGGGSFYGGGGCERGSLRK